METVADVIAKFPDHIKHLDLDTVLADLNAEGIIKHDEYLEVIEQPTNKKLLLLRKTLPSRGDHAFPRFLECLRRREHFQLADRMEEEWRKIEKERVSNSMVPERKPLPGKPAPIANAGACKTATVSKGACAAAPKPSGQQEKNAVQALKELCEKNSWDPPEYIDVKESGEPHNKMFLVKVVVYKKTYQPSLLSKSKKEARIEAASLCLRKLRFV